MTSDNHQKSIIIPILDFSPHSEYNINTLLQDLERVDAEVICIFNSTEVFETLKNHQRIDKYCYNSLNAGVSRSWNIGINLAEGNTVYILNADLHVTPAVFQELEDYLYSLPYAVLVGPQGSHIDFKRLKVLKYFEKNKFTEPTRTHDVSGFFFCLDRDKFSRHKLAFDVQYSPCFLEEWDMGLQIIQAQLACYAVPVTGFEHDWGISHDHGENTGINYFGNMVYRNDILRENRKKFLEKWFGDSGQ